MIALSSCLLHLRFNVLSTSFELIYKMDLFPLSKPSPTLNVNDGGPAYMVQCILDVCGCGCCIQFMVNCEVWSGREEKSWIYWYYILDNSVLHTFYQDHPGKPVWAPGGLCYG